MTSFLRDDRWDRDDIASRLGSIFQLMDGGDFNGAATLAERLVEKVTTLLSRLGTEEMAVRAYLDVLVAKRMPDMAADRSRLAEFSTQERLSGRDIGELKSIVARLENFLRLLGEEVERFSSDPFPLVERLRAFLIAHRKKLVWCAGVGLTVIVVAVTTWRREVRKHSLKGEYFSDQSGTTPAKTRFDRTINFHWSYGAPFWGFKADHFFVRWTGFVQVEKGGAIEFETESDDGVRLWIDDRLVIENWTNHAPERNTGALELEAGVHSVRLEYFEFDANAGLKLSWRDSEEKYFQVIPASAFYSSKVYAETVY